MSDEFTPTPCSTTTVAYKWGVRSGYAGHPRLPHAAVVAEGVAFGSSVYKAYVKGWQRGRVRRVMREEQA